jgi:hypothetical protein
MVKLDLSHGGEEEVETFQNLIKKGFYTAASGMIEDINEAMLSEISEIHAEDGPWAEMANSGGFDLTQYSVLATSYRVFKEMWTVITSLMIAPSQLPETEAIEEGEMASVELIAGMAFMCFSEAWLQIEKQASVEESVNDQQRLHRVAVSYAEIIDTITGYSPNQAEDFFNDNLTLNNEMKEFIENNPFPQIDD